MFTQPHRFVRMGISKSRTINVSMGSPTHEYGPSRPRYFAARSVVTDSGSSPMSAAPTAST